MKCETVVADLPLYVYGELPPQQEEEMEAHIHVCACCQEELEAYRAFHAQLDRRQLEPPPMLLVECRRNLMQAIAGTEPRRAGWLERLFGGFAGDWRGAMRPAGALALVALGFFSARLTMRPTAPATLVGLTGEPVVSTIRSLQPDLSGGVLISFDETRRREVAGKVGDDQIERLLVAAARDEANPGLRFESIEILKNRPASDEVRSVLIHAVTHDPNPGVRLKALEGLKSMASDPEVRKSLAGVLLRDDNPGIRIQAIDLLMQQRNGDLVGILQNLLRKENNNYVRLRCQNALEEMNASVGTF